MPHRLAIRTIQSLFLKEPWWAEWWSGLAAVGWSLIARYAEGNFIERPALRILAELGSEQMWEMVGLMLGLSQIVALLLQSRRLRWAACFFLGWWWLFLAFAIHTADQSAPAVPLYLCYAGINLLSLARLLRRFNPA